MELAITKVPTTVHSECVVYLIWCKSRSSIVFTVLQQIDTLSKRYRLHFMTILLIF